MSSNHAALSMFRQYQRHVGTELPAAVREAMTSAEDLRRTTLADVTGDGPSLADAVAAAVRSGADPMTSADVQRALLVEQMGQVNISARLVDLANREITAALTKHADSIIQTWRPVIEQAAETLAAFRALAPGADLGDTSLATQLPARALTPWAEARDAAARLGHVAAAWIQLAEITGHAYIHFGNRPLILADLDLDQLDKLGTNPTADTVARLDVPLALASAAEFAERAERINAARAEVPAKAAADHDRAVREGFQRSHGTGQSITVPSVLT